MACRLASAAANIVHDCDEVYNYWEPLHYIMYGYGMQTWEYGAQFALRCWLYLLLHAGVGAPAAAVFGAGRGEPRSRRPTIRRAKMVNITDTKRLGTAGKVAVVYFIKAALGLASALTEWALYRCARRRLPASPLRLSHRADACAPP